MQVLRPGGTIIGENKVKRPFSGARGVAMGPYGAGGGRVGGGGFTVRGWEIILIAIS